MDFWDRAFADCNSFLPSFWLTLFSCGKSVGLLFGGPTCSCTVMTRTLASGGWSTWRKLKQITLKTNRHLSSAPSVLLPDSGLTWFKPPTRRTYTIGSTPSTPSWQVKSGLRLRGTDPKPLGSLWEAEVGEVAISPQPIPPHLLLLQRDPSRRTRLRPGRHLTAVISNEMRHRVPPPQDLLWGSPPFSITWLSCGSIRPRIQPVPPLPLTPTMSPQDNKSILSFRISATANSWGHYCTNCWLL